MDRFGDSNRGGEAWGQRWCVHGTGGDLTHRGHVPCRRFKSWDVVTSALEQAQTSDSFYDRGFLVTRTSTIGFYRHARSTEVMSCCHMTFTHLVSWTIHVEPI